MSDLIRISTRYHGHPLSIGGIIIALIIGIFAAIPKGARGCVVAGVLGLIVWFGCSAAAHPVPPDYAPRQEQHTEWYEYCRDKYVESPDADHYYEMVKVLLWENELKKHYSLLPDYIYPPLNYAPRAELVKLPEEGYEFPPAEDIVAPSLEEIRAFVHSWLKSPARFLLVEQTDRERGDQLLQPSFLISLHDPSNDPFPDPQLLAGTLAQALNHEFGCFFFVQITSPRCDVLYNASPQNPGDLLNELPSWYFSGRQLFGLVGGIPLYVEKVSLKFK